MKRQQVLCLIIIIPIVLKLFGGQFALAQTYIVGVPVCDTISRVTSYAHEADCGPFDDLTFRLDSTLVPYVTGLSFQVQITAVHGRIWSNLSDTIKVGDVFPLPAPVASGRLIIFLATWSSFQFVTRVVGTPTVAYENYFCESKDALTLAVCHNYLNYWGTGQMCQVQPSTKVEYDNHHFPATNFRLSQNYPNPFNPETTIEYTLPKPSFVKLKVYDVLGQEVRTLVNEFQQARVKLISWDGKNDRGQPVPSGVYFYRLSAAPNATQPNGFQFTRKMVLMQ